MSLHTFEPGGHFTGNVVVAFLYPHMLDVPWTLTDERPPAAEFVKRRMCIWLEDLHYHPSWTDVVYSLRRGLVSDGGTIRTPIGWALASTPFRDYVPAYGIHDALCQQAREFADYELRKFADRLFEPMLLDLGADDTEAAIMRRSVQVGAWWWRITS